MIRIKFTYHADPASSWSEIWFDEDAVATAAGCVQDELRKGRVKRVEITRGETMPNEDDEAQAQEPEG